MNPASRGATGWLIAINLILTAALAGLWLAPGRPAQWRNWQAPAPQAPTLDDVHAAVLVPNPAAGAAYPEVLARPLMNATRRPIVAAAPQGAASAPPAAIEQVRLLGIVAGPALSGIMIEQGGQTSFVRRGERVGDWTLDSLHGRSASFVRNGERRQIELPFAHGAEGTTGVMKTQNANPRPATPQVPARAAAARPATALAPASAPTPAPRATVSEPVPAPEVPARPAAAASAAKPSGPVATFGGSRPQSPASAPR